MRLRLQLGMVVLLLLSVGFTQTDNANLLPELNRKSTLLKSLTAQVQQLFLRADEKVEEAEGRVSDAPFLLQGRLTAVTGTPVPTTTTAAAGTIYFTPYQGSRLTLYTGTAWVIYPFTERSITLSALTANRNYDVFIYHNGTTLALELSAAWTNNKTRTDAISLQDGVYVKTSATTRRYLGTIRTTAVNATQDTEAQRFIWNYYNRVRRPLRIDFTANTWAYNTAAWRATNNDASLKVEYVTGANEVAMRMRMMVVGYAGATVRDNVSVTFGLDTDGQPNSYVYRGGSFNNDMRSQLWSERMDANDGQGYHFIQGMEYGANSVTWVGDDSGDARMQSGMAGWVDG